MTQLLDEAIAQLRALSDVEQDRLAETLLGLIHDLSPRLALSSAQLEEVRSRQSDLRNGSMRFASADDLTKLWADCGL